MILNNLFDTSKPIMDQLKEYAEGNEGKLSDSVFDQAVSEYEYTTDQADELIEAMAADESWSRHDTGFFYTSL